MLVEPACEAALSASPRIASPREYRDRRTVADLVECYRTLSLWLVFSTIAVASLLVLGSGTAVDPSGSGLAAQLLAGALLVSTLCWATPRLSRVADGLGTLGLVGLAGLGGGVISLVGLRFRQPLVDHSLLRLDRALGVDSPGLIEWLANQAQWPATITISYNNTLLVLGISILAQSLKGRRVEAWRAAFCFIGSLLTVCLISIFTPAKGLGLWLTDEALGHLPNGAARYFWPSFDRFYSGTDPVLSLAAIDGVVSFPSFHTVMGLTTVALWRRSPIGLGFSSVWFLHMMIGAIPLGGHYFVDLFGGAAVWACWFCASRRVESKLSGAC
jgi:hypothetical protein